MTEHKRFNCRCRPLQPLLREVQDRPAIDTVARTLAREIESLGGRVITDGKTERRTALGNAESAGSFQLERCDAQTLQRLVSLEYALQVDGLYHCVSATFVPRKSAFAITQRTTLCLIWTAVACAAAGCLLLLRIWGAFE